MSQEIVEPVRERKGSQTETENKFNFLYKPITLMQVEFQMNASASYLTSTCGPFMPTIL